MRIAHVITGLGNGGAEAVLYRLCTTDKSNLHTVISLHDAGKYGALLRKNGIEVHCLDLSKSRRTGKGLYKLVSILRRLEPDVVQTWMYHGDFLGGLAARLAGRRNVCWGLHNSNLDRSETKRTTHLIVRINSMLSRWVPARIISCSEKAVSLHKEIGYENNKFVLIPNGYDVTQFSPNQKIRQTMRSNWSVPDDMPLLGMVARFYPQKDHRNLTAALGRLKRSGYAFRCLMAGNGTTDSNPDLVQLVKEQGIEEEVLLLGPRSDIPAIMNALDVHILSSAYGEAFPNVLNEAMASGTPCVTTDVGDAGLIVGEGGWIVPPRDPEELANALIQAVEERKTHPEAWQRRCARARERIVERFTIDEMVRRYTQVWSELASGGKGDGQAEPGSSRRYRDLSHTPSQSERRHTHCGARPPTTHTDAV